MIPASRFIETSDNRIPWLTARRGAVTATEVSKAATPAGFAEALTDRLTPREIEPNAYMQFGTDNEDWIARTLKADFDLMPNHWLIAAADNPLHMATPDCLSLDHLSIGEIKTGGKIPKSIPRGHRDQMQWQFWSTGAERGKYAFMHRIDVGGVYVPAWFQPLVFDIERDDKRIAELVIVADRLIEESNK